MNAPGSGGYRPRHSAPSTHKRVLAPVLLLVGMAALVLGAAGIVAAGSGPFAAGMGTFFALLPVIPAVAILLWIDRWEPEPGRLLFGAFLWGAGIATIASAVTSLLLDHAWASAVGPKASQILGIVLGAPVFEELFKGLFLILLLWFRRREFDGLVDGIVYAGLVGVGFAFTENILYLSSAFASEGVSGGIQLFIIRCVLSPFAHPIFTGMIGIAVGIAARTTRTWLRVILPCIGYLFAVCLHALWNGSAALATFSFWGVYTAVMLPLLTGVVFLVLWNRRREQRIVATRLPQFVALGWIAGEEVRLLSSLHNRRGWRRAVRRSCGREAAAAVDAYHTAITELAFLHERFEHGAIGPRSRAWHDQLLTSMRAARSEALRYSQAVAAAVRPRQPHPGRDLGAGSNDQN